MEETLTESRVSSLGLGSLTQSGLTEAGLVAEALHLSSYSEAGPASYSEAGPASLMLDSLPSLSLPTAAPRRPSMPEAAPRGLQCRHTLSGKLGSSVPVAVRRALGGAMGAVSAEDLSSISSCHSNIDNIQPPTYMEELDMDSSMISVASLTSDVVNLAVLGSSGSTDSASVSITSEAIRDMVGPAGRAVRDFHDSSIISAPNMTMSGMSQELAMVGPPTAMEDLTLTTGTGTLVADLPAGGTFVVNAEENNDTIADVPDAFDDEETVNEPTLTAGSEGQDCEVIPELPRDSRHTTPAQSGGESSVEGTPSARRKVSPKERRQVDRERYLTFTKEQETEETPTASRAGQLTETTGFRASARGVEEDRFRTRTITKEDLATSPSSSPEKSSPSSSRSSKQRRAEEGARFLTQTIGPGDLVRREEEAAFDRREEEESLNAAVLESEALRVVASLSFQGRSRSQSTEILGEAEMADSREELRSREASGETRPRVVKPWESRVQEQDPNPPGIRGRRRALYSPPMKRATIPPPVAPKPQLSRPRPASSPQTSPRLVRGTRATQLRQANARKEAPRVVSPVGRAQSGARTASPRSPRTSTSVAPLVRQGTFTKDDTSETASTCSSKRTTSGSSIPSKRTPPKLPSKPSMFRKDTVSPSPTPRPLVSPRPTKTQTLREQSLSRGGPVRSSTSSSSSVVSRTSATSVRSMRTSSSSHSLRSATESSALPRRVPSSSDIERRRTVGVPPPRPSSAAKAPLRAASPGGRPAAPPPKKNVTSKIANLWKRVEDSQVKAKAEEGSKKYKSKDKRIWLGGSKKYKPKDKRIWL